jgi:signal transduction histidine kinase
VILEVTGPPSSLAPGVDLTAYRIVQEALTNSLRHAHAARAHVALTYEPGYITVAITDVPADPTSTPVTAPSPSGRPGPGPLVRGAGLGLAGIAERVASCGGHLSVGPTEAGGFAVVAKLPSL